MHWAFIGDLQMPYQDNRALALWFDVMKWWKPKAIDFVGDVDDQLCYSSFSDGTTDEFFAQLKNNAKENTKSLEKYSKDIDAESKKDGLYVPPDVPIALPTDPIPFVKEESRVAREFYRDVRQAHKNADMHSSLGNHDIRIFNYMDKKAPEYNDQITPENLWGLDNLGISWRHYDEMPLKRFGEIHVHHGTTTTSSGLAVKSDIDNYNISLVRGHDHRGGVVYKSYPMNNTKLVGMGCGHMCDPRAYGLRYTINPSWELGFGIGHVFGDEVQLQFIPITSSYECVVDGKLFKG